MQPKNNINRHREGVREQRASGNNKRAKPSPPSIWSRPERLKANIAEKSPPWRRGKIKFTLVPEGTLGGPDHTAIYTDGSKSNTGTGAGVVIFDESQEATIIRSALPETTSVFQAELYAIKEAMIWISNNKQTSKSYHIYSDSRSALQAITGIEQQNRLALQIYKLAGYIQGKGPTIKLFWIKAHVTRRQRGG